MFGGRISVTLYMTTRKFYLNEHYFDVIDSEDKSYWLGFLMADGCVTDRGDIVLSLAPKDFNHLQKFNSSLSSSYPIKERKTILKNKIYKSYGIDIRSRKLCLSLSKMNIIPRKSLAAKPPKINADLLKHFWRGVFDGDGSIYPLFKTYKTSKYKSYHAQLVGSHDMMVGFSKFLDCFLNLQIKVRKHKNIFSVTINRWTAMKVLNFLYHDSSIFLSRKRALAAETVDFYAARPEPSFISKETKLRILDHIKQNLKCKTISQIEGVSENVVNNIKYKSSNSLSP